MRSVVLVCLGCYNKIPLTLWLINNRNLFLTVLEAGESNTKVLAYSVSDDGWLSGSYTAIFSCVLTWQKNKESLWGPFYKGTNPVHDGSSLKT